MAVFIYTGDVIRADEEPVFIMRIESGGQTVYFRSVAVTVHREPAPGASEEDQARFDEVAAAFERGEPAEARRVEEKAFMDGDSLVQLTR